MFLRGRQSGRIGNGRLRPCEPRLQVDDIEMPAAREQAQILFIPECD